MALINIEYGSLASSDVMNKNLTYLDDRISEVSSSTTTLISSILSNIATINARLGDLSEDVVENAKSCTSNLDEFKNKTKILINNVSMLPNWGLCYELTSEELDSQIVKVNGYLLLYPKASSKGNITVNETTVPLKARANSYDNAAQMFFIPVKQGDKVQCTVDYEKAFFLPAVEFSEDDL